MPRTSPNFRLAHLAYLLMIGVYDDAREYRRIQSAVEHARGEGTFVLPGDVICPTTGEYLYATPEGTAIRCLLDALVRDGVAITAAHLRACHNRQLFVAMKRLRRDRLPDPSLQQRLEFRVLERTGWAARCLSVTTPPKWSWWGASFVERDPRRRLWLLRGRGGMEHVRYLAGIEGGQIWIMRLPDHVASIEAAGGAFPPPALLRAREEGHQTRRHGDLWIYQINGDADDLWKLPPAYKFDPARRLLSHPEHGVLHLPFTFTAWPTAVL